MSARENGASFPSLVAGWPVKRGRYGLPHFVGGDAALVALPLFLVYRRRIALEPPGASPSPEQS